MRSKLFVPASRPELFTKALNSHADGLSFDLEDSVTEDKKSEARNALAQLLVSPELLASKKKIIIRVNSVDSQYFMDDLTAVIKPGVHMINLPKIESPKMIEMAVKAISEAEKKNNVQQNAKNSIRLLINIETPKSLRIAHELASAHERVAALQLGLGDLFEPYGIERNNMSAVEQAMFSMAMAAHEYGIAAYDGAFAIIANQAAFKEEAFIAKSLGFLGKSCIHPSQIELANEIFKPTQDEIEYALEIIAADAVAQKDSVGAYVVDGKMIDAPYAHRARALLNAARQYGLLD